MDLFYLGIVVGAGLALIVFAILARQRAMDTPEPAPDVAPPPPRRYKDPLVERVYGLQARVLSSPLPSIPEDLLRLQPFVELIETLAAPAVSNGTLTDYFYRGEDLVIACAAMGALARRPRDPGIEELLLSQTNNFHPWCRDFRLRALEAWRADDPQLAGRVLLRIDESWHHMALGPILDGFLRRRAAVARPSLAGLDRPPGFDESNLQRILASWVDPTIAQPLLAELRGSTATQGASPSAPPAEPGPAVSIVDLPPAGVGRVLPPHGVRAEGLLSVPSADVQLEHLVAALSGSPRRSVLIVGEPGVGKTSLARRAAARLSEEGWTIFEASASQVNAGMSLVGSLEERLRAILQFLGPRKRILWIVPDFPQLLWAGRHLQNPTGALEMLVPALDSGQILMLGEARPPALERVLVECPEVERLFEIVRLEPPSDSELAAMLDCWATATSRERGIEVPRAILAEAVALARQYLLSQPPPGGVLRLLGGALARVAQKLPVEGQPRGSLAVDDLVEALAQQTGLPLDILDERCALDLDAVRRRFETRVIGQPEAIHCLVDRLVLLKAGVTDPARPTGVFLFVGGSGTGKTELARTLAEYLFGSAERLIRVDMSELQDYHALERLLGDPRNLQAKGNSLVERVRRQPFSVVLLDEFDRASPYVWDVFLQVFDAGRLTDRRGDTADFRHTIIILTSNVGTASSGQTRLGLVGGGEGVGPTAVRRAVERAFRPELLNRLDQVVVFQPLTREVMRQILDKELADAFARRGLRRRDWAVEMEESAIELLVEQGFSPTLGARPLKRALERLLLTPLAAAIVNRSAPEGDQFLFVRADGDSLAVEFVDPDAPAAAAIATMEATAAAGKDLASILYEARGSADEVEVLRLALAELQERVQAESWILTKQALLLESAAPGFWECPDRFERLGRVEYMDRVESGLRSAASLLERLRRGSSTPRSAYPREMVKRLAQQLYLVRAAQAEALETGPRDAFLCVEPSREDVTPAGATRDFARRVAAMYEAWARARGMRLAVLGSGDGERERYRFAISGFGAYRLLAPEAGLHVLEWDEQGGGAGRRASVRVRVAPQPVAPASDGVAGLRRQADEALGAPGALSTAVVRRYRETPSPLVRDLVRKWRTGRIERVLGGDFDVIPAKG